MKRLFRLPNLAILLIAALIVSTIVIMIQPRLQTPQVTVQPIDQLYVFGDSLSDVGNVFRATGGQVPAPPYFEGRHSNGKVWVEELASRLNLSGDRVENFAWGGATTGRNGLNQVPGVLAQVETFVQNQKIDPQALFVVWAGANDYLFTTETPTTSIDNLNRSLQSLIQSGAKRLLVANLPDLGQLPATRNTEASQKLSNFAATYNRSLQTTLDQLRKPDLSIAELDVFRLYQTAIKTPDQYGFTNVTNACLGSSANCDRYLFWDGIHPTTAAHKVLGDLAFEQVKTAIR
ncbi:SGNH/GDSL hydrolase family protein [Leptolyngbya sp. NIES-2104]|uniref:SGNH/GDSL hydrolase family protein n=1 Tax=Leptolyngbya sp. NIES-2104 TaxID=1552121 RepID=UPI0006EC50D9|nr:SGNH/GDSL hydrolase family protein [Leptolyngbya sp. NIES-2104]GAP96715.1 phospholipase/lecithinase/hemolysin [Leptolyngbya sp. NIES-2104]